MTALIGWALAIASTLTELPQSIKLFRSRDSEGVSTITVALAAVTMAVWSAYTFQLRDWPALGSSLGPLLAWGGSLVLLSIINKSWRIMIVAVLVCALVLPFLSLTFLGILAAKFAALDALPLGGSGAKIFSELLLKREGRASQVLLTSCALLGFAVFISWSIAICLYAFGN